MAEADAGRAGSSDAGGGGQADAETAGVILPEANASERTVLEGSAPAGGAWGWWWPPTVPAPALIWWRRPLSWLAVGVIKGYQRSLSKLWPNVCKFHPSCSHYMIHAIGRKGLIVGGFLGTWRILRCNPFSRGGYDPPPGYEEALREADNRDKPGA